MMNPFGIVQAVIALFEGAAYGPDPKRQKERTRFLFWYVLLMLLGIAVIVSLLRSLYFAR
jgi:hypothetical protein